MQAFIEYIKEGEQHSWKSEGHYTKDGKEWKGPQHAHDGQVMTGEKHTADSQDLYHYKELSADIRKKISKTIGEAAPASQRLTTRLKSSGVDLVKRAKDRAAEHAKLKAQYTSNAVKDLPEATYQGKKVTLNKPSAGDVKKSKVYVDLDGDGKATKVNFGDKNMTIKKNIPARKKSFRARHKCDQSKPKDSAGYWSCKAW